MRQKLAATIALASFAAVTVLGVGMAGADPLVGLGNGQQAGPIAILPTVSGAQPACSNAVDDDGDGLTDLTDPDCTSPSGESEGHRPPPAAKRRAPPAPR